MTLFQAPLLPCIVCPAGNTYGVLATFRTNTSHTRGFTSNAPFHGSDRLPLPVDQAILQHGATYSKTEKTDPFRSQSQCLRCFDDVARNDSDVDDATRWMVRISHPPHTASAIAHTRLILSFLSQVVAAEQKNGRLGGVGR
jgi:hypothetical protein